MVSQDLVKSLCIIMEGKTDVLYIAFSLEFFYKRKSTALLSIYVSVSAEVVKEVIVEILYSTAF